MPLQIQFAVALVSQLTLQVPPVYSPHDAPCMARASSPVPGFNLVNDKERLWPTPSSDPYVGPNVYVKFLDGGAPAQERVRRAALEWTRHCGVRLVFLPLDHTTKADVTVTFLGTGYNSLIGTDSRSAVPSMRLGGLDGVQDEAEFRRVVLHEFGHALGLYHEHLSPGVTLSWNRPYIYQYYAGPPNNWDKATVDNNLFTVLDRKSTNWTAFDPASVMLYWFPKEFTTNGVSTTNNTVLSESDKKGIGALYPAYVPPKFDGRVGPLVVRNSREARWVVVLWHPNSRSRFTTVTVPPFSSVTVAPPGGPPYQFGSDWGLQWHPVSYPSPDLHMPNLATEGMGVRSLGGAVQGSPKSFHWNGHQWVFSL